MSLQDPQEHFEREMEDSNEDEVLDESSVSDSDTSASEEDVESVNVPEDEAEPVIPPASEKLPSGGEEGLPPDTPEGPAWYVIHCYSGYENKVRHNLEQRIETMGMKDRIFDVVIPTQEEIEVKDGKRRTVERHIFPGYVLVNMQLTEESWYVVRNTPGVTGFVGMGNNPTPLRPEEVSQIIKRMEAEAPTVKVTYKVGERV
ncbi:MAG: transcription termination/antitermination protein NusG, partial [Syntrophothermus sp.]